jgi:hypothetical protein
MENEEKLLIAFFVRTGVQGVKFCAVYCTPLNPCKH